MSYASEDASVGVMNMGGLLRRNWIYIMLWTTVVTAAAIWGILHLAPNYRATATLLLNTRVEHLSDLKSVVSGPMTAIPDPAVARGEVEVLRGRLLAATVISNLDLQNSPDLKQPSGPGIIDRVRGAVGLPPMNQSPRSPEMTEAAIVDAYLRHLSVFNDGRSYTFDVSYTSSDPVTAAKVANTLSAAYLEDQRKLKQRAAERATVWLGAEIARLRTVLDEKEHAIRDFQEKWDLNVSNKMTGLERQISDLGTQLAQARADISSKQARTAGAEGGRDAQPEVIDNPLIRSLRGQEATIRQRLAGLGQSSGLRNPEMMRARSELGAVQDKINLETTRIGRSSTAELATARQRAAELQSTLTRLQVERDKQARAASQVEDMEGDLKSTRTVYAGLLGRLGEIQAQVGAVEADARLISPAAVPVRPYYPNVPLFSGIAFVLAAASSVALAWLVERRRLDPASEQVLANRGLTSLGQIPTISLSRRRNQSLPDIMVAEPRSVLADSVRALREDVILAGRGASGSKVIALTSALPGEGKTTTTILLARSLVSAGHRVLLLECDLRRPTIAGQLGIKPTDPDMTAVLQGTASVAAAVVRDPSSSLDVIVVNTRTSRPQDHLGPNGLGRVIESVRKHYDYVLIDTPPVGAVSDAISVATHADTTLLVVRWGATPATVAEAAVARLSQRGLTVSGIIFNNADLRIASGQNRANAAMYRASRSYAEL